MKTPKVPAVYTELSPDLEQRCHAVRLAAPDVLKLMAFDGDMEAASAVRYKKRSYQSLQDKR